MTTRISRRDLFGGLAATTALLPLLNAERSWAATYPRRVLLVMLTNGMIRDQFWPKGGDGRNLSTMTLPPISASLAPYKSDLVFMRGVDAAHYGDTPGVQFHCGHYSYTILYSGTRGSVLGDRLSVTATSATIDQVIADHVAGQVQLPIRSLHTGVFQTSANINDTCCFRGPGAPVIPEIDPKRVFDTLFAGMSGGPAALARLKAERRSVLDYLGKDLTRFSARLGTEDRQKVQAHLDSVREVERQTAALGTVACTGPQVSQAPPRVIESYPAMLGAQMDLITAAFRCDLTRVATLQLSNFNGDGMYLPWLGYGSTYADNYHAIAHEVANPDDPYGTTGPANKIRLDTWFTEQLAALIRRFKETPEGSGSMLDNTAIVFTNHMGDGRLHDWSDLPCIIAGGCGGAFRTGLNLAPPQGAKVNSNTLWIALANAMGMPITTFGDAVYGTGPAPGLMV